ncbi:Werner Syndrome-like exonuclease [Papaver somniferum]|uniref:Werner Syndrome-like exonuclease n=1 Tax=Papaver somniferum TaxID=3469 RepID=UPI000E6F77C3|nr:Werner Syndrome-like exonuclease [Papaver somniferum]
MAGAVNKPKNGNAMSNTSSSNKNGTTSTSSADVTHTESVVDQWIEDVYNDYADKLDNGNLVVGLDIEWARHNKVDVLQLCFAHRCLIYQFFDNEVPESLITFLNDDGIIFVRAGIDEAAHKLLVDYGLNVARTQDLGRLADCKLGTQGLYQLDLNSLVNIVLGQHLHLQPKFRRISFSRWDRDTLKNEQVEYACLDAYASFKLGLYLFQKNKEFQEVSSRN